MNFIWQVHKNVMLCSHHWSTNHIILGGVFRTQPNIYNGDFLRKWLKVKRLYILQKSSIVDVWESSKDASNTALIDYKDQWEKLGAKQLGTKYLTNVSI